MARVRSSRTGAVASSAVPVFSTCVHNGSSVVEVVSSLSSGPSDERHADVGDRDDDVGGEEAGEVAPAGPTLEDPDGGRDGDGDHDHGDDDAEGDAGQRPDGLPVVVPGDAPGHDEGE